MQLRDFLYLDAHTLHSYVSQIEGGLVSLIKETVRKQGNLSGGLHLNWPIVGVDASASGGLGSEAEIERQITNAAQFNMLHQYLTENSEVKVISDLSSSTLLDLKLGQFIEIWGTADPPVVETWIERLKALVSFIESNFAIMTKAQRKGSRSSSTLDRKQIADFKQMVDFLEDYIGISRRDPGKCYIRLSNDNGQERIWCGLLPEFTIDTLSAVLPARVCILGRVDRKLGERETYEVVDFSPLGQQDQMLKLLDALGMLGPIMGQRGITASDLQARHPDIFVTPLAIFR